MSIIAPTFDERGNALTYTNAQSALDKDNNIVQIAISWIWTYNENNTVLSFSRSDGISGVYTYDKNDNELTYIGSDGYSRGF